METLQTIHPNISCRTIDKEKSIAVTQSTNTIPKHNIDMHPIKSPRRTGELRPPLAFRYCGKLTKCWHGITTIDKLRILGSQAKVGVVAEASISKQFVDVVGSQMAESVRTIWRITRTDGRSRLLSNWEECLQRGFGDAGSLLWIFDKVGRWFKD